MCTISTDLNLDRAIGRVLGVSALSESWRRIVRGIIGDKGGSGLDASD